MEDLTKEYADNLISPSLKVGDKVECIYGEGNIFKLPEDSHKVYTIKMTKFSGVGYPSMLMAVHESNITLLKDKIDSPEFVIPPLGGQNTEVRISRNGEEILLTEGEDYTIEGGTLTFTKPG